MAINATEFIWRNGEMVPWDEARVHVLSHVLHYGSSVFEGVRAYDTPRGPQIFRLTDHIRRLYDSARIYRMEIPFEQAELVAACRQVIRDNGLTDAYLRPIAFRGYGSLGVAPRKPLPIEVYIAGVKWGAYLGEEGLEQGVDVCVSSWRRPAPGTTPAMAKAGGNYLSSQLIGMEAHERGYAEGIALTVDGLLSEGSGENLFLVRHGVLYTPAVTDSILAGITRDTVLRLAEAEGLPVREQPLPREMLHLADEVFLTGTAAEITPVRSVDGIKVGTGRRGPVTKRLQDAFFGLFRGETADRWRWLEPVYDRPAAALAAV